MGVGRHRYGRHPLIRPQTRRTADEACARSVARFEAIGPRRCLRRSRPFVTAPGPRRVLPLGRAGAGELVIVANPDEGSSLRYLLRLPIAGGLVFRTAGTWPRTKALFCYPMPPEAWPGGRGGRGACPVAVVRPAGAAIEVVADRARENRSQLVFTTARGREMVFWQSPRTRKQARPNVALPTARAAGLVGAGDHRRHPRALRLPVRRTGGGDRVPGAALWRLRRGGRRPTRRRGRTQVSARPRQQRDQREAALRAGRPRRPPPRRRGGRGPLLGPVQTASRPSGRRRRRPGRVPDSLADHPGSCSARHGSWPRNGPTATSPPPGSGPPPNPRPRPEPRRPTPCSSAPPNGRSRPSPKCEPGPAGPGSPSRTGADSAPRSGTPGVPRNRLP